MQTVVFPDQGWQHMDEALDLILDRAQARIGSLMVFDPAEGTLRIVAARGFPQEITDVIKKLRLAPGQGIAGHVYEVGQPYYLKNPQDDPLFVRQNIPLSYSFQFLSIPLRASRGQTIGVLNLHFPTDKMLSSSDLEHLAIVANQLTKELLPSLEDVEP